jgi:hypothetical protein
VKSGAVLGVVVDWRLVAGWPGIVAPVFAVVPDWALSVAADQSVGQGGGVLIASTPTPLLARLSRMEGPASVVVT